MNPVKKRILSWSKACIYGKCSANVSRCDSDGAAERSGMNRILLVDDNPSSRNTLQAFFGAQGFSVMAVEGLHEGSRVVDASPDFIILRFSGQLQAASQHAEMLSKRSPRSNVYILDEEGNCHVYREPAVTRDENWTFWMRRLVRGLKDFPRRISNNRNTLMPIF